MSRLSCTEPEAIVCMLTPVSIAFRGTRSILPGNGECSSEEPDGSSHDNGLNDYALSPSVVA